MKQQGILRDFCSLFTVFVLLSRVIALFIASVVFSNFSYAKDVSTSCAMVRTISVDNNEMWVEVVNNCGECVNISMNWSLNGKLMDVAGTWGNVPVGGANRYRVPMNRGFGVHKAEVVRVETCK